jgi:ribosomal protein L11 methyltransferase
VRWLRDAEWLASQVSSPVLIGKALEILHEPPSGQSEQRIRRLFIPHGMAFGSGEHATTSMLLRALTEMGDLRQSTTLDIGTGSGVLALAARLFGAKKIVATDWDFEAIRTARQNEINNFGTTLIRWQQADVRQLRATRRYHLIVANLFSGILCEAAGPIVRALLPEGQLWLSGILRDQEKGVITAYRREHLELLHSRHRGKWVMLQWQKSNSDQEARGGVRKIIHTK